MHKGKQSQKVRRRQPQQHPQLIVGVGGADLNYRIDEGFGFGGVATLYHLDDQTKPYKDAITLKIFISTADPSP